MPRHHALQPLILISFTLSVATGCLEAGPVPDDLSEQPYDEEVGEDEAALAVSTSPTGTGSTTTIRSFTCTGTACWCLPGSDREGADCTDFETLCTRLARTIRCCRFFSNGTMSCENRYNEFADYCSCS